MADTIFAQATPPGRSGIAVIRVSGPAAAGAVARLTPAPLVPRRATRRLLRHPSTRELIDEALLIAFPAPGSFSGEDVVEIQCHGSRAVTRALLKVLGGMPGLRSAEAGEFTRRALENGRLDLSQVEGLADLLAAETEAQHRQAMTLMRGGLSQSAQDWRAGLVSALAAVEATIDFADEDVPEVVPSSVPAALRGIAAEMKRALAGAAMAERIRDGFEVALVGAPNAGKSTLLNILAGRDVAITSAIAGTTRDVLEVRMDLRGLPVTLLDTAGLRGSHDDLERLGIERARRRASAADLRVLLTEAGRSCHEYATHMHEEDIVVESKADLYPATGGLAVSGVTGQGVDQLLDRIAAALEGRAAGATALAHARQRDAVAAAGEAVDRATERLAGARQQPEIAAAELQAALRALDFLVGRVDVEAILDVVFRDFCLGK